jgi:adenine specific DNA methylase Mod
VWDDITEIFRGKKHINEKPSKLAEVMISVSSNKDDLVVDLFAGSGSTGVAAEKLGRKSLLVEKGKNWMYQDDTPWPGKTPLEGETEDPEEAT